MKDTIVTAIYYSPTTTRMGGRGYTFEFYQAPFRNIINLDCNIVVYSHESEIHKIEAFFSSYNFTDYKIINYDPNSYLHSDKIYSLKEQEGIIDENGLLEGQPYFRNDRNHHICLSKLPFLKDTIESQYFKSKNYYWIDAGLFHHGIFPEAFGGIERLTRVKEENYWPIHEKNVCTPEMVKKLQLKSGTDLVFIGMEQFPRLIDWTPFTDKLKDKHIVGGFFGGKKAAVLQLAKDFDQLIGTLMADNVLTLEEEVLSILFAEKYNKYGCISFLSWYHDVPESPNYYGAPFSDQCFYKIFI